MKSVSFNLRMIAAAGLCGAQPAPPQPPRDIAFNRDGALWVLNLNAGEDRRVLQLEYDRPIIWTPDGDHIIFWKHSDIGWDFWQTDVSGEEQVRLTAVESGGCRMASFSHDGKRIAFMRDAPQGVHVMSADGSQMRRLTENGHRDYQPQWSPDGERILYLSIEGDGPDFPGSHARIYSFATDEDSPIARGDNPVWGGDGETIILERESDGVSRIVEVPIDADGEPRPLSDPGVNASLPAPSPDGSMLACIGRPAADADAEAIAGLYVSTNDGGPMRLLCEVGAGGWCEAPQWSPDGSMIALAHHGEKPGLLIVNIETGERVLHLDGDISSPRWRPRDNGAARQRDHTSAFCSFHSSQRP